MATRILTLFDEEDFFGEEAPAPKPLSQPKAGEQPAGQETVARTGQDNAAEQTGEPAPIAHADEMVADETLPPQPATQDHEEPAAAAYHSEPIATHATAADSEQPEIPEAALPERAAETTPPAATAADETAPVVILSFEAPVTETEPVPEPESNVQEEAIKAADEALNKQIISELIQMDYTALIHKDYPFDLNKAQVVTKKQAAPVVTEALIEEAEEVQGEEEALEEDETFEEIVPLPEWNLDKKYYTIGEVAQLFAVNTSHIRFWTNEFKLKPRTTRKGDRLYNPKDIAELRLIHHLVKEKKHTIKGAREKLKAEKSGVSDKLDLKESLSGLRDILLQIKEQL